MRSLLHDPLRVLWLMLYCVATVGGLAAAPVESSAESLDASFVAGLRERKLFELAERYCVDRINSSQSSDIERAEISIELIRTLATHAGHVPRADRATFWQSAQSAAADFERRWPANPRHVLVRIQAALVPLARGELARREHDAGLLPAAEVETARQALAQAIQSLEELDKAIGREVVVRRRTPAAPGGLPADELVSLQRQVQYYAARARRMRGLLYPSGSDDRLAQLVAARQLLAPLQSEVPADAVFAALARLEVAECARLAGRYEDASEALTGLDADGVEPGIRLEARAIAIRLTMDRQDSVELRRLLEEGDLVGGVASAELDVARFEGRLALSELSQAAAAARRIDQRHGGYWTRLVGQLLADKVPSDARVDDLDLLTRRAEALLVLGKLEEALADYSRAAQLAREAMDDKAAFELEYKAALVLARLNRPAEAASRLRALAMASPQHPQAAAAHLLAAWHTRRAADQDAILREHLTTWSGGESAGQAHLLLAQLAEAAGHWREALDHYAAVPGHSPAYAEANARLGELAQAQPDSGPVQEAMAASLLKSPDARLVRAAAERWHAIAGRSQPDSPRWLRAHYSVAWAQLKLGDKAAAAGRLREVLAQPRGMLDTAWKDKYAALLKRCAE